jgi:hypothetical protein
MNRPIKIKIGKYEGVVLFRDHQKKVVVCTLRVRNYRSGDGEWDEIVTKSKCNFDEGDKFDLHLGQQMALEKAVEKMIQRANREKERLEKYAVREVGMIIDLGNALFSKVDREQKKPPKKKKSLQPTLFGTPD